MAAQFVEAEADAAFSNLETLIKESIHGLVSSNDSRAAQVTIKNRLTDLRASIRLLEESAEEQDRWDKSHENMTRPV